jgi:hypothetical protein
LTAATQHPDKPAARERGSPVFARRSATTSLASRPALREAEHLTDEVRNKALTGSPTRGERGTTPLDVAEAEAKLREAYDCASLALTYLYSASSHLRDQPDPGPEPARL